MNRLTRTLFAAGAAALTLAAGTARADQGDRSEHRALPALREGAPHPAPPYVVDARWRDVEARREYRELELARARFYAHWHGDLRARARFESWCAARRVELDRGAFEHGAWRR